MDARDEHGLRVAGRIVSVVVVVAALAMAVWVTRISYREPRTDDAQVRANLVGIAPHVSGPIVELHVVDNQAVRAGDLLFVVDPRPYEAERARAHAARLLAETDVTAYDEAVASAEAEVARLEAELTFATDHHRRLAPLVQDRFVTSDRWDEAGTQVRTTTASLERARRELARQQRLVGQVGDVNARIAAADAAVAQAALNVEYCRVHAPFDARVTNLNIAVGQYARAGREVFALVDTRAWYVMANYRETFLASIHPDMPADVFLLSYPGRRFRGTVQGVGWAVQPDDGATVGVLPAVERSLNWVRLAQRIPVRIALEDPDPAQPYRMGMTAVVTIREDGAPPPAAAHATR